MRQVNIRTLKAKLSAEMKDLPFAVTNNGKVVGYMVADCSHNDKKDVVTPKQCSHNEVPFSYMGGRSVHLKQHKKRKPILSVDKPWVNPLANSILAPKACNT